MLTTRFGFKITDTSPGSAEEVIAYAIAHRIPIELGLYNDGANKVDRLVREAADHGVLVNTHSNHLNFDVGNLHLKLDEIEAHIDRAKAVGSKYSIIHITRRPPTRRHELLPAFVGGLVDNLVVAEELCDKRNFSFYLENVWNSIPFYRNLIENVLDRGLKRINFCFDIGHAKVWSENRLEAWMFFLDYLAENGIGLHMHLHGNRGLDDEHLSLERAQNCGAEKPDNYFNQYGLPGAYWVLDNHFPDSTKIFEVGHECAIANLESVLSHGIFRNKLYNPENSQDI